jgi:hypothetical protein
MTEAKTFEGKPCRNCGGVGHGGFDAEKGLT